MQKIIWQCWTYFRYNIQQCYDEPNIVCQALDAIINCAKVPGVFPIMEEAGM